MMGDGPGGGRGYGQKWGNSGVSSLGDEEEGERTLPLGATCRSSRNKSHQAQDFLGLKVTKALV